VRSVTTAAAGSHLARALAALQLLQEWKSTQYQYGVGQLVRDQQTAAQAVLTQTVDMGRAHERAREALAGQLDPRMHAQWVRQLAALSTQLAAATRTQRVADDAVRQGREKLVRQQAQAELLRAAGDRQLARLRAEHERREMRAADAQWLAIRRAGEVRG
jgi:hypothetical protein